MSDRYRLQDIEEIWNIHVNQSRIIFAINNTPVLLKVYYHLLSGGVYEINGFVASNPKAFKPAELTKHLLSMRNKESLVLTNAFSKLNQYVPCDWRSLKITFANESFLSGCSDMYYFNSHRYKVPGITNQEDARRLFFGEAALAVISLYSIYEEYCRFIESEASGSLKDAYGHLQPLLLTDDTWEKHVMTKVQYDVAGLCKLVEINLDQESTDYPN